VNNHGRWKEQAYLKGKERWQEESVSTLFLFSFKVSFFTFCYGFYIHIQFWVLICLVALNFVELIPLPRRIGMTLKLLQFFK
jgi:hypothetical protein